MSAANYDESLRRLLTDEGGYTNHPSDPGGPTNFGITIFDYRKYVKPTATAADIKAMKVDEAKRIYRAKYWDAQKCDQLPSGVDYAVFDYGVNSGIGRSGKVLRRVMGMSDSTSIVTPEVIAAAAKRNPKVLMTAICDERLAFLRRLKTWSVFGGGWGRRVAGVKVAALRMIERGQPPALPVEAAVKPSAGKGQIPPPTTAQGAVAAVGGGGAVAAGGGFWDWMSAHPVPSVLFGFAAAGLIALIIIWLTKWNRDQQEAPVPNMPVVPPEVKAA